MESSPPLAEDPQNAISENGFFSADDQLLGQNVRRMDDDATPFASAGGLLFCKANVLDNPRIQPILVSYFESPALGLYRSIGTEPPGIYTFRSDPSSPIRVLAVQLWSRGSRGIFWKASHKHWLDPVAADNSLLRVPPARIRQLRLEPSPIDFEQGGFVAFDDRTAFSVLEGTATTFAFGNKQMVRGWSPMKLPKSVQAVAVNIMESTAIWMNVEYV